MSRRRASRTNPFDEPEYSYLRPSAPPPHHSESQDYGHGDGRFSDYHAAPRSISDDHYSQNMPDDRYKDDNYRDGDDDHRYKNDDYRDDNDRGRAGKPRMRRRISHSADVGDRARRDEPYTRPPRHRSEQRRRGSWAPNHDSDHDEHDYGGPRHRTSRHPPPSAMPRSLGGMGDSRPRRRRSRFEYDDNLRENLDRRRRNSGFHRNSHHDSDDEDYPRRHRTSRDDHDFDPPRRHHTAHDDDKDFDPPRRRHTSHDEDSEFDRPRRRHTAHDDDRPRRRHSHHSQSDNRRRRSRYDDDDGDDDDNDYNNHRTHHRSSSADPYRPKRDRDREEHKERGRPRQRNAQNEDEKGKDRPSSKARSILGKVLWGAAIQAGLGAAMDMREKPGPWIGEKGARVASAAVTSGLVDTFFENKKPERKGGLRYQAAKMGFSEALGMAATRAAHRGG